MKISIGTAQFGLDYGVSNAKGKTSPSELKSIFDFMEKNDLCEFDTAQTYGDSESLIGKRFGHTNQPTKVVSKFSLTQNYKSGDIKKILEASLTKLQTKTLFGMLLHNFSDYYNDPNLWNEMIDLRSQGVVEKVGFSLYSPRELDLILDNNLDIDIVQIPFSLFDQRFKPYFKELLARNVLIYCRSTFMQGLVFLDPSTIDKKFNLAKKSIGLLKNISNDIGFSINSLCLNYVLAHSSITKVIIGVTSADELKNNIGLINEFDSSHILFDKLESLGINNDDLDIIMKQLIDTQVVRGNQKMNKIRKVNSGVTLWNKAKKIIPGGNQLLSKRAELFLPNKWPTYYKKAKGIEIWDMDNNKYYDYSIMGIGACNLGYANYDVDKAVKEAVDNGSASTFNSFEEVDLAEKLLELHPWAAKVRFANAGGEINSIAIRIARAASKKDVVAFCGYHGWSDWYLATNLTNDKGLDGQLLPGLQPNGVPKGLTGTALPFHYGNTDELQELIDKNPNKIGVIMIEIARYGEPDILFVKKVQELAKKIGAVLIFDEISSGFRAVTGGMHIKYGLEPDMVTFGKALGNGYPITALIGKEEIMQEAQTSFISSTNWTARLGFVAALATIKQFETLKVADYTLNLANYIRSRLKELFNKHGLKVDIKGMPSIIIMIIAEEEPLVIKTLITQEMLKRGYLASTIFFVTYAHTKEHCEKYLSELTEVVHIISNAIKSKNLKDLLDDEVCHGGFARLN